MKNTKSLWLIPLLVSSLTLTACANKEVPVELPKDATEAPSETEQPVAKAENKVKDKSDVEVLQERLLEQETELEQVKTEAEYYKEYVRDVTLTLSPEKMKQLIDKEWNYSLTVNNVQFPKNGIIEIAQSDFELIVAEKRVPFTVLPEEESLKGKLPTELLNSFSINAPSDKTSSKADADEQQLQQFITYSFKGLSANEVVRITLSDELASKLQMSTSELEIRISD